MASLTGRRSRKRKQKPLARAAMGDLLAVDPGGVVFGRSATELTFHAHLASHRGHLLRERRHDAGRVVADEPADLEYDLDRTAAP